MKFYPNKEIYKHALQYHFLANAARLSDCELKGMTTAYVSIQVFSIELMLKSLSADSFRELELSVGDVNLYKTGEKSTMTGHLLSTLFRKLPDDIKSELRERCDMKCYNAVGMEFVGFLEKFNSAFIEGRYIFEDPVDMARFNFGIAGSEEVTKVVNILIDAIDFSE